MHNVETVGHCAELLRMGIANRITSATTMNAHSSRLGYRKPPSNIHLSINNQCLASRMPKFLSIVGHMPSSPFGLRSFIPIKKEFQKLKRQN